MTFVASIIMFLAAVVIHEVAHGWVANRLGDSTALRAHRLTLNPVAHVDPIGTIVLPLSLALMHSPVIFGWAKPVPINVSALHNPKRDIIWVGLAGPVANLLLAALFSVLLRMLSPPPQSWLTAFLLSGTLINLVLACFNVLPIPPLDGSRVLAGLLPRQLLKPYAQLERYGFLLIFALLYFGLLDRVVWPLVGWFMKGFGLV